MKDQSARFHIVAEEALTQYGLEEAALTFIRHSDTASFRVDAPHHASFLLRLHVPITHAMGTHGADVQAVDSELVWLEALCQDADLILQKPVRNRDGGLVTPVRAEGGEVNCTLLSWLEGQPYHRDLESADTARQIGVLFARLHRHASQWTIPAGFKRPRRDTAYFENALRALWPAVTDGRIGLPDFRALETSVARVVDMLSTCPQGRQSCGIMHADGHKGNMLYHEGEIRLIDFSFCTFGNYMFDLGICLSDMKPPLHGAFLAGYQGQRALAPGYPRLIEGLFVGSMVGTFSYWVENPQAQEVLVRKVPQVVRDYADKFNQDERFWFR